MTIVRLKEQGDKKKVLGLIKPISRSFSVSDVCIYDKLKHKIYQLIKLKA